MSADVIAHGLSFALRALDHFTGAPVPETLAVSLDAPVPAVASPRGGIRHTDGTYRWIDLAAPSTRYATVSSPSGQWTSWTPGPVPINLPLANPGVPIDVTLWPTPAAAAPPGVIAVRGKLLGAGSVLGLQVSIDPAGGAPLGKYTLADVNGEFLYLLPGGPWPLVTSPPPTNPLIGTIALTATVAGHTISTIAVTGGSSFAGPSFNIEPRGEVRVVLQLA